MTEEHIVTLIAAVIASGGVSTIISWILHRIDVRHQPSPRDLALEQGVEALEFAKLQQIHDRMVCRGGWCPDSEKEVADRAYRSYHALGGNGLGTSWHDDIMRSHSGPSGKSKDKGKGEE